MAITLSNNSFSGGTAPGLPAGASTSPPAGSQTALNADSGDWNNYLQPTSLSIVGSGKTISFPCLLVQERQSNALVEHTFPNLDSGYQENMGRNPATFVVKAALTNNIYPNSTEAWTPGILFPNTFENLLNLLLNTSTDKTFVHPIYGSISVQVASWDYDLNAKGPRDGVFLDMVLKETVGQNNPLSQQITSPASSQLAVAANALDNAVISPPGLSLSGFFTQLQQTIGAIVSIPNNVVNALNANIVLPVLNGGSAVGGALYTAPSTVYQNLQFQYQTTRSAVLGAIASENLNTNSFNSQATQAGTTALLQNTPQDPSVQNVYQSFITLNNQPSQTAVQLIGKAITALNNLQNYYINQNLSGLSTALEATRAYIYSLQQQQSALSNNSSFQSVSVQVYVPSNYITWQALAKKLNNSVDQLMGLNTSLINNFVISPNTPINYYQSNNQ